LILRRITPCFTDKYGSHLVGISGISPEEAEHLYEPTTHLPHDNRTYVVSLGVFHQLHCVNHLRKALYPDEYPGLWTYHANGSVDHSTILSLHWGMVVHLSGDILKDQQPMKLTSPPTFADHCIDILRQTLMCHADITPMPYYYRASDDNIYSVLASTQTCRKFDEIKHWAIERQIHRWRWNETHQP